MKISTLVLCLAIVNISNVLGQNNIKQIFEGFGIEGSTTIYDQKNSIWYYTDSLDAQKETLPASTFKILNSCIALEMKVIKDENEVLKWDGEEKSFYGIKIHAWNSDTDLKNAFKNSTIWFFTELAKRIGKGNYTKYLKQCGYGNMNLSEKGDDFWNIGNFCISPVNQIKFLIAFYNETLPFSEKTYRIVKKMMISEKTQNYTISSKTGWTKFGDIDTGWWIGYVERDGNTYYFATRLKKDVQDVNYNFANLRKEITCKILKQIKAID